MEKFSINYKISDDPNSDRVACHKRADSSSKHDELYLEGINNWNWIIIFSISLRQLSFSK